MTEAGDDSDFDDLLRAVAAAPAVVPVPALIGGRYRPVRLLGKGGMGAVYEVEHVHTGQRLALKTLTVKPGASVERFQREARAASSIQDEHIVRVTDADVAPELGGAPYFVMELLEGADLERVAADKPVPPDDVVLWLRQIAHALEKAHRRGIVHRDLKPENLFLTHKDDGSPLVKILDFGVAKVIGEHTKLTHSDQFVGTPIYMAPEQADSAGKPVTPRSDGFALGLIAFRLLVGKSYWKDGSLAQLLAQILAEPMPPPSERGSTFGPELDAWFLRACDRDPAGRFASCEEQVEALAAALGLPERAPARTSVPWTKASVDVAPVGADAALGAPRTLDASSTEVSRGAPRAGRRRWLGGLLAVGAGASLVAAAWVRRGVEDAPRAAAEESPAVAPAASPSMTSEPALAETSADAVAPRADAAQVSPSSASSASSAPSAPSARAAYRPSPAAASRAAPAPSAATAPKGADAGRRRDPLEGQD